MDWDQIESKWAAMTRRVRGDLSTQDMDVTGKMQRRVAEVDAETSLETDRPLAVVADQQTAMPTQ